MSAIGRQRAAWVMAKIGARADEPQRVRLKFTSLDLPSGKHRSVPYSVYARCSDHQQ